MLLLRQNVRRQPAAVDTDELPDDVDIDPMTRL
jgi:hypothetical protein